MFEVAVRKLKAAIKSSISFEDQHVITFFPDNKVESFKNKIMKRIVVFRVGF